MEAAGNHRAAWVKEMIAQGIIPVFIKLENGVKLAYSQDKKIRICGHRRSGSLYCHEEF